MVLSNIIVILVTLLYSCFAGLVMNVTLSPGYAIVNENEMAVFNCSYTCKTTISNSHTTSWHVGDVLNSRTFAHWKPAKFIRKTGLYVEVKDFSNCDKYGNGLVIHQLRINASSASRWNKTAVQCIAVRADEESETDFYSAFSLMFVVPAQSK